MQYIHLGLSKWMFEEVNHTVPGSVNIMFGNCLYRTSCALCQSCSSCSSLPTWRCPIHPHSTLPAVLLQSLPLGIQDFVSEQITAVAITKPIEATSWTIGQFVDWWPRGDCRFSKLDLACFSKSLSLPFPLAYSPPANPPGWYTYIRLAIVLGLIAVFPFWASYRSLYFFSDLRPFISNCGFSATPRTVITFVQI